MTVPHFMIRVSHQDYKEHKVFVIIEFLCALCSPGGKKTN